MTPIPKALRILVVEDDALVSQSIQNQLLRLGYELAGAAYDGEEALAMTRQFRPDAILMDMRMPDPETGTEDPQAGLKATQEILQRCPTAIILLTAFESPELLQQATQAGVSSYLLKPVKDNDLDRAIHVAVARYADLLAQARLNGELLAVNQDLKRSEAQFRALSDSAPMGIFKVDGQGVVTYLSPHWGNILGCTPAELQRENLVRHFGEEDRERFLMHLRQGLATREPWMDTFQIQNSRGDTRWVHCHCAPITDGSDRVSGAVGVADDITERRRTREVREQAQRREALAVLAGGIAHDFNNLLTAVQGNLELALYHSPLDSPLSRYLEGIQDAIHRASELSRQMLAFSGHQTYNVESLDLNRIVSNLEPALAGLLSDETHVEFRLHEGLPPVRGDVLQFQQVVHSLVMNAAEALTEAGGRIRIATRLEVLDRDWLEQEFPTQAPKPGLFVALSVEDSGCGMDAETLQRIFDPFFSTKFMGRGLGLPATHGILQAHGALLHVVSTLGEGSIFTVYFPAEPTAEPEVPKRLQAAPAPKPPSRSGGRILLVDDEDALRESIAEFLQILGFEVVEARDGIEAVTSFTGASPAFDLVIMDLTMPRMNGHEAFRAIHGQDPGVKVILSSGYAEHEATRHFIGEGLAAFLQKPYALKDLERLIGQVLG